MNDLNKKEKVIASRLNVARRVRGYNTAHMALSIHLPVATYRNYEIRDTALPVGVIFDIIIALDCSKDFLTKQKGVISFNGDKITIK